MFYVSEYIYIFRQPACKPCKSDYGILQQHGWSHSSAQLYLRQNFIKLFLCYKPTLTDPGSKPNCEGSSDYSSYPKRIGCSFINL